MRKNTLLIAVAAVALAAGSGTAFAQGAPKADGPAVNPAAKNAPAERIAPAPSPKSGGPARMQGVEQKGAPAERTGQAPATDRSRVGQANERNKANRSETTGQAPNQMQNQPTQRTAPKSDRLNDDAAKSNDNRTTGGQAATDKRRGSASLSGDQKTKIHSIIVGERSAPRVAHVDFQLNVGIAVPRTVRLAPIPTTIVEIEPTWRGFEYFLVGDELVVVDPATLEIVAVLPA